ncbi:MAG TPA: hypothetical protein VLS45_05465 [Methylomicrobium sp.]|nr:hypothetical protein [Methylomicrobium sp.]
MDNADRSAENPFTRDMFQVHETAEIPLGDEIMDQLRAEGMDTSVDTMTVTTVIVCNSLLLKVMDRPCDNRFVVKILFTPDDQPAVVIPRKPGEDIIDAFLRDLWDTPVAAVIFALAVRRGTDVRASGYNPDEPKSVG